MLEAVAKIFHSPAMASFTLPGFDLERFVRNTLAEDLGEGLPGGGRDVTACDGALGIGGATKSPLALYGCHLDAGPGPERAPLPARSAVDR